MAEIGADRGGELTANSEAEAKSKKVRLLADIRTVFEELAVDRLPSATLVAELAKDADGPWAAYGRRGKPITQRQVATLLSDFTTPSGAEIKPRKTVPTARSRKVTLGTTLRTPSSATFRHLPISIRHTATDKRYQRLEGKIIRYAGLLCRG